MQQILQELESEDNEGKVENKSDVVLDVQKNIDQLGIQMNQEGLDSSKCGKEKAKRGRKYLKELREVDDQDREQQKIDQIFNNGKGKCLPKET